MPPDALLQITYISLKTFYTIIYNYNILMILSKQYILDTIIIIIIIIHLVTISHLLLFSLSFLLKWMNSNLKILVDEPEDDMPLPDGYSNS